MTALFYEQSTLLISLLLFLAIMLTSEVGYWSGLRFEGRFSDLTRGQINAIQASMLGILALIMGFSFSTSLDRFNSRCDAVVDEANAIGTGYLRANLTPLSIREPTRKLLREYVDVRNET